MRARHRAKSMPSQLSIGGQQCGPEERGQFAGRGAAHQVHLKIAVLAVHVSQRAGQIVAAPAFDGRDARGVALDRDARREAGQASRNRRWSGGSRAM